MVDIKEIMSKANDGNSAAQNELGICYSMGKGVEKDDSKAFYYFKLASEGDLAEAKHNLGVCYAFGNGVKKNLKKAVDLLAVGAFQGNDEAIFLIEELCRNKKIKLYCDEKKYFFSKAITIAYFDILGFSNFVKKTQMNNVVDLYNKLIKLVNLSPNEVPCVPQTISEDFKQNIFVGGVVGKIHTCYSSDSFLIWMCVNQSLYKNNRFAPYWLRTAYNDPFPLIFNIEKNLVFYSNSIFYHSFLEICMSFFCEALKQGIPLRGCVSTGQAYFDEKNKIYIGKALVEAVSGESARRYMGIDFGISFNDFHPIYNKYFIPNPLKINKNEEHTSMFSLDWARYWRINYKEDDCYDIVNNMCKDSNYKEYYDNTLKFYEFSEKNENWSLEMHNAPINNMDEYIEKIKEWVKSKNLNKL